ncbi:MAG: plasmid recombination protein [Ruminococcus sp.]|nr:plasmid recombination protein [Ruminococcus sp.]
MASINWMKARTAEEVKALLRHDEREKREATHEHSNFHIDKSRTYLNYSIIGRTYKERCEMYDKALEEAVAVAEANTEEYVIKKGKNAGQVRKRKKGKLRKDAVTALNLYAPVPADLPQDDYENWFKAVHDIMTEFFGEENVIDSDIHFDEVHEYFNTFTKEWTFSRVHMHTMVVPRTADGRLCCNEIFTRQNCIKLNNLVEEMTRREFGVAFNTGEEPHRETVEALKSKSFKEETKLFEELNRKKNETEVHIAELRETQIQAEQDTAEALAKKKEAEDEVTEKKAEVNEVTRNLNGLCIQIGIGERELDKVNGQVTEAKAAIAELQETQIQAEHDTAAALTKKKETEDELKEKEDDLDACNKQIEFLNLVKGNLRNEKDELINSIGKFKKTKEELVKQVQAEQKKLDNLTQSTTMAERVNKANEQAGSVDTGQTSRYDTILSKG